MKFRSPKQRKAVMAKMRYGMIGPCNRTVTKVIDGDTFRVAKNVGGSKNIRLAGVNAPEIGEYGAAKATKDLKGMIDRKPVHINPVATDKYGRTVAEITQDRHNINKRMKDRGY